jgi:membrane protease YdiL (CAAX protease family)
MGLSGRDTLLGVLMAIASVIAEAFVATAFSSIFEPTRSGGSDFSGVAPRTDFVAAYVLSVVNPVFEEVFVCGYVIQALSKRFGETTAINVSVAIRATYHLYQGIDALPHHLTYGLIQAYVFARTRKLWPLIVSHGILDFIALIAH